MGATGAFPVQQTGNDQFKCWFLHGACHNAPRYPPQGFPEMLPSLAKPSLSLFAFRMPADLWASRGIWKMLSPDECQRSPGSVEKRSHLSMVRNGNSHGDSSHRLSGHLTRVFGVPSSPVASLSLLPRLGAGVGGCLGPGLRGSSLSGLSRVIAWWEVGSGLGGMNERETGNLD